MLFISEPQCEQFACCAVRDGFLLIFLRVFGVLRRSPVLVIRFFPVDIKLASTNLCAW